jgi:hypothetical protein
LPPLQEGRSAAQGAKGKAQEESAVLPENVELSKVGVNSQAGALIKPSYHTIKIHTVSAPTSCSIRRRQTILAPVSITTCSCVLFGTSESMPPSEVVFKRYFTREMKRYSPILAGDSRLNYFQLWYFGGNQSISAKSEFCEGDTVEITGKINSYREKPEIVLKNPTQPRNCKHTLGK